MAIAVGSSIKELCNFNGSKIALDHISSEKFQRRETLYDESFVNSFPSADSSTASPIARISTYFGVSNTLTLLYEKNYSCIPGGPKCPSDYHELNQLWFERYLYLDRFNLRFLRNKWKRR